MIEHNAMKLLTSSILTQQFYAPLMMLIAVSEFLTLLKACWSLNKGLCLKDVLSSSHQLFRVWNVDATMQCKAYCFFLPTIEKNTNPKN